MSDQKNDKFYWMKLKKNTAKSGKTYWTGNFSYAIDIIGFEKDDGTMTVWFSPKDMDKMKQDRPQRPQQPARPQAPPPPPRQYPSQPAPSEPNYFDGDPGPEDDLNF